MEPSESTTVELIGLAFYIALPFLLLCGSWLVYFFIRRSRDKYLTEQEQHFQGRIRMTNLKQYPEGRCRDAVLVTGSAVIANNYFVSFLSGLKHLFGGEMKGYTALCTAARRMALVRMLQEAESLGANAIYNVRFETATIVSANNRKQTGGVELIAYGTGVKEEE